MALVDELYPTAKVVACVRDPTWIINSFETIVRRNPLLLSRLVPADQSQTVYSRVDSLAGPDGAFGFAWRALQDAVYGPHAGKLILVDYDALVADPRRVLEKLYGFIGIAPFGHDLEAITYEGGERFDAHFGLPGLHAVRRAVQPAPQDMILPPDLIRRFSNMAFWTRPRTEGRPLNVVLPPGVTHDDRR